MKYTEHYNLKKPDQEDFYNVDDFNENADIIDAELKRLADNSNSIPKSIFTKGDQFIVSNQDKEPEAKTIADVKDMFGFGNAAYKNVGAGNGLDADTVDGKHASEFAAANHNHDGYHSKFVAVTTGGGHDDPNTTLENIILTDHANGPAGTGAYDYYYIQTFFWYTRSISMNRCQIATSYLSSDKMFIRHYYGNQWSPWSEIPTVERMEELMIYPTKPRAVQGIISQNQELSGTWATLLDIQGSGIVYYIYWCANYPDAKIRITVDGVQSDDSVFKGPITTSPTTSGQNIIVYFKNALKIEVYHPLGGSYFEANYAIQYALV